MLTRSRRLLFVITALLSSCHRAAEPQVGAADAVATGAVVAERSHRNVVVSEPYPADISPPPGTHYPCALTALPKGLPGIPEPERGYINRTYTKVLRATQAKLIVLRAVYEKDRMDEALRSYDQKISDIVSTLRNDEPPSGLENFQSGLISAIELQQTFFRKAVPIREAGHEMDQVYQIAEGQQASSQLMSSWSQMESRYPNWSAETKDSIYHHLCALDLF